MIQTSEIVESVLAVTTDGVELNSPGFADVRPAWSKTRAPLGQIDMGRRARRLAAS